MASRVALMLARGLRTSAAAWKDVQIVVPHMTESISEGTVSQIVKGPGQG